MLISERVKKALELCGGTHTFDDLMSQIRDGDAQIWGDENAVIVTEIHDTPQLRVLHFWVAAGELDPVLKLSDDVIEWGRTQGCTRATLTGRKGWVKTLVSRGWEPASVMMGREI